MPFALAEDLPDFVFLVGMVADDAGFPRGWACGGGVSTPSGSGLRAWDTDGSYADWYAGHEIGHSQGRAHPDPASDDPATDGVFEGCGHSRSDSGFPWMNAAIGDSTYRGFDMGNPGVNSLLIPRVYSSGTWTDMMSYCDNQWISDYTFEAIKDQVEFSGARGGHAAGGGRAFPPAQRGPLPGYERGGPDLGAALGRPDQPPAPLRPR